MVFDHTVYGVDQRINGLDLIMNHFNKVLYVALMVFFLTGCEESPEAVPGKYISVEFKDGKVERYKYGFATIVTSYMETPIYLDCCEKYKPYLKDGDRENISCPDRKGIRLNWDQIKSYRVVFEESGGTEQ